MAHTLQRTPIHITTEALHSDIIWTDTQVRLLGALTALVADALQNYLHGGVGEGDPVTAEVSLKALADLCGTSVVSTRRAAHALERRGLIEIIETNGYANRYRVVNGPNWGQA